MPARKFVEPEIKVSPLSPLDREFLMVFRAQRFTMECERAVDRLLSVLEVTNDPIEKQISAARLAVRCSESNSAPIKAYDKVLESLSPAEAAAERRAATVALVHDRNFQSGHRGRILSEKLEKGVFGHRVATVPGQKATFG